MSYHVAIVRTGPRQKTIREDEVVSIVGGRFGLDVERDASGSIKQLSKKISGEDLVLFYDDGELWAKTPTPAALSIMIEIARGLGGEARVRGDEGETYETVSKTYRHPDDADAAEDERPRFYWKYFVSRAFPIVAALILVLGFGALLLRHLSKTL